MRSLAWQVWEDAHCVRRDPVFPPVDIIKAEDTGRVKDFVAVWRHVRRSWVMGVLHLRRPLDFATRAAWRSFSVGTFLSVDESDEEDVLTARKNFAEFLEYDRVLWIDRNAYSLDATDVQGPVDEVISAEVIHETIQELTDLEFFFALFEVEYMGTGDDFRDIVDWMKEITRSDWYVLPGTIPRSSFEGLVAWPVSVGDFMESWPGVKPPGFFTEPSAPFIPDESLVLKMPSRTMIALPSHPSPAADLYSFDAIFLHSRN